MSRVAPESWVWILIGLFVAEVVAIVWACVGGTWLAAKMWPEVKDMRPPFWGLRVLYWAIVGSLLVWNVKTFSAVGKSLYHKVPLFKSHYSIVPGSMEFDGLGLMDVLSTEPSVGFALDVQVENPTPTDFVLEENRLEVRHEGELVATTSLVPFVVPAGSTRVQQLGVDLDLNLEALGQGLGLLSTKEWELTLFVEVAEGIEFPVYIH